MLNEKQSFTLYDEIVNKADIVDVIGKYIPLKRKGANYVGLCPFHSDTNASLSVSPQKKIWKCFVCADASGNVISFVQKYEKISYFEAAKKIAQMLNLNIDQFLASQKQKLADPKIKYIYDINQYVNNYYEGFLFDPKNQQQLTYLHQRGLTDDLIRYFHLGYAPNDFKIIYRICTNDQGMFGQDHDPNLIWNEQQLIDSSTVTITSKGEIYDFFIDRITFPIYDRDGMILGFTARATGKQEPKYLNSKETLIFNKSRVFFNAQNAFLNHPTILVLAEGPMDVIAIHRAGIKSVVGTMGVNCSDSQINMISNVPSIKTIVLAFDNDQAGINANIAIGQKILSDSRFGATNLFVIKSYDQKFKDLDELLRAKDAAYVKALIDQPIDFISYLITHQFTNVTDQTSILQLTNELLSYLVEHDDLLLKTTHLELLAKLSKINLADINLKYRELSDQKIAPSYARKSNIKIAVPRTAINSHTKTSTNPQIIKWQREINQANAIVVTALSELVNLGIKYPDAITTITLIFSKDYPELESFFIAIDILKLLQIFAQKKLVINPLSIIDYFQTNGYSSTTIDEIKAILAQHIPIVIKHQKDLNPIVVKLVERIREKFLQIQINNKRIALVNAEENNNHELKTKIHNEIKSLIANYRKQD